MKIEWLKNAVIYQIYPTSFYDANGDGTGDLQGIVEKIAYIKELGVNTIWVNPFYVSPFMDGGYDVVDYYSIDKRFGTMQDFERLVETCKENGLRLIIDLVIGHTSDKHPWFIRSGKDEKNEYTDRYIWTDSNFNKYKDKSIHGLYARDGGYVINYYACQPALNYGFNCYHREKAANDAYDMGEDWQMHYTDERLIPLREEILNIMRFWLKKGVDGFRVDLANSLVKGCVYNSDKDEDIEGLKWLWNILIGTIKAEYPETAFLAEWVYPSNAVGKCGFDIDYIAHDFAVYNDLFRNEKGTNILPVFERGYNYFSPEGKGCIDDFLNETARLHRDLKGKGYFSVPSGYHDIVRLGEKKDEETLKVIFAFLLTYKHVPMIYYGDEIGMTHNFAINKDGGYIRTGCRTPMQWNSEKNAGFSTAEKDELYLPVTISEDRNVSAMEKRENTLLNTVKALLKIRQEKLALSADADLRIVQCENGGYPLVYERKNGDNIIRVAINPSSKSVEVNLPQAKVLSAQNCEVMDNNILLKGKSYAIVEI